jgi:hypothetical protein
MMMEEATGFLLPSQAAAQTRLIRQAMTEVGWTEGRLLMHIHSNFGLATAAQLECITAGADGVWCAVCRPGAHVGHACSSVTLANLARFGNQLYKPHIGTVNPLLRPHPPVPGVNPQDQLPLERYNLPKIVEAARVVHEIATMAPPAANTEVYGCHAFDIAFPGWHGFQLDKMDHVAKLCGYTRRTRITAFSTIANIRCAMTEVFGSEDENVWTTEDGDDTFQRMRNVIRQDLVSANRLNYNTPSGLASLFECAGGRISNAMLRKITETSHVDPRHPLLAMLKHRWYTVTQRQLDQQKQQHIYQDHASLNIAVFLKDVLHHDYSDEKLTIIIRNYRCGSQRAHLLGGVCLPPPLGNYSVS